jgi:hypothetical protein
MEQQQWYNEKTSEYHPRLKGREGISGERAGGTRRRLKRTVSDGKAAKITAESVR